MLPELTRCHRLAGLGADAGHEPDLCLEIQPLARAEPGDRPAGGQVLAMRADDRGAGDDHRAGPAVVAGREVQPVSWQRGRAGAEDLPDRARVVT